MYFFTYLRIKTSIIQKYNGRFYYNVVLFSDIPDLFFKNISLIPAVICIYKLSNYCREIIVVCIRCIAGQS